MSGPGANLLLNEILPGKRLVDAPLNHLALGKTITPSDYSHSKHSGQGCDRAQP